MKLNIQRNLMCEPCRDNWSKLTLQDDTVVQNIVTKIINRLLAAQHLGQKHQTYEEVWQIFRRTSSIMIPFFYFCS